MSGVTLMASQIGGALAPLLIVPIQSRYGWRASFFVFGLLGAGWATVWYIWFRDSPAEKIGAGSRNNHKRRSYTQPPGIDSPGGRHFDRRARWLC
jgi:sugar phosphate permease